MDNLSQFRKTGQITGAITSRAASREGEIREIKQDATKLIK